MKLSFKFTLDVLEFFKNKLLNLNQHFVLFFACFYFKARLNYSETILVKNHKCTLKKTEFIRRHFFINKKNRLAITGKTNTEIKYKKLKKLSILLNDYIYMIVSIIADFIRIYHAIHLI